MLWKRLSSSLRFGFAEGAQQSVPGHKAPSITDKPAGRYASSLFSAASKNECLQTVLEDMSHLQQLIKSQENFKVLLKNASIKRKQFREIFELFAPQNYHPTTVNLINSLTEAGR